VSGPPEFVEIPASTAGWEPPQEYPLALGLPAPVDFDRKLRGPRWLRWLLAWAADTVLRYLGRPG